jgi:hypothetical protein
MRNQSSIRIEPLGAFNTIVTTKAGKVLSSLCLHELLQVLGRHDVGLDLVDISSLASCLGNRSLICDTHFRGNLNECDSWSMLFEIVILVSSLLQARRSWRLAIFEKSSGGG